jgi:glycosyltransferase involved in cell wall biosynthesis
MANVLLVSYTFPPSGGIGVPRALAYTRYLPEHGCRMFVLTPSHPATPVYDTSLLESVPAETVVVRAFNPEPPFEWRDKIWKTLAAPHRTNGHVSAAGSPSERKSWGLKPWLRSIAQAALFPDIQTLWIPFAMHAANRMVEQFDIDTVILNVPPFSTLKIGVSLKRRFPRLRVISDFRDDWMGYYIHHFDSPAPNRIAQCRALERAAVECSDLVVTVTNRWVEQMSRRYPDQRPEKFVFVPNGYDPQFFSDFSCRRHNHKMVVTYFGTIHNNRVYSPHNYIQAVEKLPKAICSAIENRFVGRITPDAQPLFRNRSANLRCSGFLPKKEGIRLLEDADVLLLIATDPGSHAGKLFEYLATGKPILALSPAGGEIDDLLQRTGSGICVDPWDIGSITLALRRCFDCVMAGRPIVVPDPSVVKQYSWPAIMSVFAETLGMTRTSSSSALSVVIRDPTEVTV